MRGNALRNRMPGSQFESPVVHQPTPVLVPDVVLHACEHWTTCCLDRQKAPDVGDDFVLLAETFEVNRNRAEETLL